MTNEELLAAITAQFNELKGEIKELQSGVKDLRSDVEDLREDCEITRDGVNSLLDWAEHAGKVINFPIAN